MLCDRCQQRPANVYLTEITNGQKKETHLCEVCAREIQPQGFGFSFLPQMSLQHFLSGLLKHDPAAGKVAQAEIAGKNCGKCGLGEGQFVKQGLLGCGECYRSFEARLEPLLRRIHGNTRHTGKVPERTGGRARLVKELERLKEELRGAVVMEEFERAAEIRDAIRELEKRMKQESEEHDA
ncbi:MAG: hypothetical protein K6T80_05610 [Firmicutes bacterium]|nr:hypothetical protein [Bacillota bacterium]